MNAYFQNISPVHFYKWRKKYNFKLPSEIIAGTHIVMFEPFPSFVRSSYQLLYQLLLLNCIQNFLNFHRTLLTHFSYSILLDLHPNEFWVYFLYDRHIHIYRIQCKFVSTFTPKSLLKIL